MRDKECRDCLLKGKCVYSYVFETPPPADTKVMRKYEAAPHPFVIEPPLGKKSIFKPGEELVFGLTLIGRAVDYLPYFVYTFDELGKGGIGKGRGRFELKAVRSPESGVPGSAGGISLESGVRREDRGHGRIEADTRADSPVTPAKAEVQETSGAKIGRVIYSAETKMLTGFETRMLDLPEGPFESTGSALEKVTLNFLTPTRIAYDGRLGLNLEFHILVRNLLRRLSLLSYFHGNGETLDLDFKGIIEKAKDVKAVDRRLHWYDWERYSGRQEQHINMGGFIGEITFEGDLSPFLPFIKAGEVVHVGKGTTFGLGNYESELVA